MLVMLSVPERGKFHSEKKVDGEGSISETKRLGSAEMGVSALFA